MHEFSVGGHTYRSGKMNVRQQLHVARRIGPLVSHVFMVAPALSAARRAAVESDDSEEGVDEAAQAARAAEGMLGPFTRAFADMSDQDCDYVLDRCLAVVQRATGANGQLAWSEVFNPRGGGRIMYEDIELAELFQIAAEVIMDNLSGFFGTPLPGMPSQGLPEQRRAAE